MTHLFGVLLLSLLPSTASATPAASLERIEAGCVSRLKEEKNRHAAKICECVRTEYEKKSLSAAEFDLMARSYEDDARAETELQQDKFEDLILFDFRVVEACMEQAPKTNR